MNKTYSIVFDGKLAERRLTKKAAEARAFELIKSKGWDANKVEVVQQLPQEVI